jgi:DNA processing protein
VSTPVTSLIAFDNAAYPPLLREIPDPPPRIYAMGRIELLNAPCLAIVGARNATALGRRNARAFARELSNAGLCIVSGLALGIDAAAHAGGLEGAASSIAVMGTGADIVYPPENAALAQRLKESGCVITEYPSGTPPRRGNFPRRNRLISGLSKGVLVVEASRRSGSLITARLAAQQNREAFALPGSIHSPMSRGCHELIREGAKLVECIEDVLVELGVPVTRRHPANEEDGARDALLAAIGCDPLSLDQIAELTGLAASACAARLSLLEIDGRIDALPGGRFQRSEEA